MANQAYGSLRSLAYGRPNKGQDVSCPEDWRIRLREVKGRRARRPFPDRWQSEGTLNQLNVPARLWNTGTHICIFVLLEVLCALRS